MPTIEIPSDIFERITHRAAVLGSTVEALVVQALENVARDADADELEPKPIGEPSTVAWTPRFEVVPNDIIIPPISRWMSVANRCMRIADNDNRGF